MDEQGSVVTRIPAAASTEDQWGRGGLSVILEENIHAAIGTALAYGSALLERIDPTQRMTHVGIAARIEGAEHLSWRTRAEHDASPNSVSMAMNYGDERPPVSLSRPRAALRLDRTRLIEDNDIIGLTGVSSAIDDLFDGLGVLEAARASLMRDLVSAGVYPGEPTWIWDEAAILVVDRTYDQLIEKLEGLRRRCPAAPKRR